MAYTVLARRYRSQAFGDVVGQEGIAQTLRRAIATGRVAHAYLFTGTRGVGKTSMARLFARALNAPDTVSDCPRPGSEADQPQPDGAAAVDDAYPPADVQQRMAEAIMRGDDMNVIEIDAASNRSVEEARQLIANASLSPTDNARHKVYIVDEVHMLTREAFNTLLKTMEEPPPHVKFILCTTEPHRVPATIQSRCQRFDFRDIPTQRVAEHLKAVLERERVDADEQVLWQLARLANGSMRDALSLLDRLIATGESPLTGETLEKMLGLPDQQLVAELIDAIADGDVAAALQRTGELLNRGIGQDQLIEVLVDRLRQLMLLSACGADSELVEMSDEARQTAAAQAQRFDAPALTYMIALCDTLQRNARSSPNPRALLDAVIVRLALAEKMADISALLAGDGGRRNNAPAVAGKKKLTAESPAPSSAPAPPAPPRAPDTPQAGAERSEAPDSPPQATEAPADVDPNDPVAVWTALIDTIGQRGSAWLRFLEIASIGPDRVMLRPLAGHREVLGFCSDQRLTQIAEHLRPILGRRVRVSVERSPDAAGHGHVDDPAAPDATAPSPGSPAARAAERRDAMNLPLVQRVLEVFPDATLLDARDESEQRDAPTG